MSGNQLEAPGEESLELGQLPPPISYSFTQPPLDQQVANPLEIISTPQAQYFTTSSVK